MSFNATRIPGALSLRAISSLILCALFAMTANVSSADAKPVQKESQKESQKSSGNGSRRLIAAHTKRFEYKEGFERRSKDIVNTLKDNEVARFQTLLEGLEQSYGLDNTLKNNGPFTMFAPTDRAWKAMPADDRMSLFANRKKLQQVLSYMVVKGKYDYNYFKEKRELPTLEGGKVTVEMKYGDVWVDKALVQTADIECSNGIIHVIDTVIMPKLKK